MKKFLISSLVLGGFIMSLGSVSVQALEEANTKALTGYSFRVPVDNDRPGQGGAQKKLTNNNYAYNANSSIKYTSGTIVKGKLWSRIVTAGGSRHATDEDDFSSGGASKMAYGVSGKNWNGYNLEIRVRSSNVLTAPADVTGTWQADQL